MKLILNKIIISAGLVILAAIYPVAALAWDDCPKGMTNDPYPGSCSRYIDTDSNGICDHSEPAPMDRIAETETILVNTLPEIPPDNTINGPTPKPLVALGVVSINLTGLLIYASYKKRR